jgi:hypothetical protein
MIFYESVKPFFLGYAINFLLFLKIFYYFFIHLMVNLIIYIIFIYSTAMEVIWQIT